LGVNSRFVLVYSGSIDGWYLTESMVDFFVSLQKLRPTAHFLWLTPSRHDRVRDLMRTRGIGEHDYTVMAAASQDVPSYLAASDVGLAFIKPCFSKLASSPTKTAEYLACGLPLITNAGIGDSDALITGEKVGALVREFSAQEYERAATALEEFTEQPEETRRHAREVAAKLFDVRRVGMERYARLYERVLDASAERSPKATR
jgi:glycosyltransferase involved in cell wall biosynthesis